MYLWSVETVDQYRSLAMQILLGFLMGIILIQILIALSNLFCGEDLKPRNCCMGRFLAGMMSALAILALFLAWLLAGILMATTTVVADVCADPGNVITLAGAGGELEYFLECASLSEAEKIAQNPFKE